MNESFVFKTNRESIARRESRTTATNEDYANHLIKEIREKDDYIAGLEEALLEMSARSVLQRS